MAPSQPIPVSQTLPSCLQVVPLTQRMASSAGSHSVRGGSCRALVPPALGDFQAAMEAASGAGVGQPLWMSPEPWPGQGQGGEEMSLASLHPCPYWQWDHLRLLVVGGVCEVDPSPCVVGNSRETATCALHASGEICPDSRVLAMVTSIMCGE